MPNIRNDKILRLTDDLVTAIGRRREMLELAHRMIDQAEAETKAAKSKLCDAIMAGQPGKNVYDMRDYSFITKVGGKVVKVTPFRHISEAVTEVTVLVPEDE